jgi:lipooligosaccharide transport system permease protein
VGGADLRTKVEDVSSYAVVAGRGRLLFERNLMVYRRTWMIILSGVFEPLFYLLSLGIGLEHFVGRVPGPGGRLVDYSAFVAPALLASAAMNGAVYDATNVFWKMKYNRVYDAVLSTPIGPADVTAGETAWALFRGFLYALSFLAVAVSLGLVESAWGVLALPGALVIGFAFAGLGVAASTFMRTWQDFELLTLVQLPMFLFSATFFPISTYPHAVQWLVRVSPLYHATQLLRALNFGTVGWPQVLDLAYLLALGLIGVFLAQRRLGRALLK